MQPQVVQRAHYHIIMQVLTFLRGDTKHKFSVDSEASDTYAVYLSALLKQISVPTTLVSSLRLLPYVMVSGPARTFLKENTSLKYIPSGRGDRGKDAPHTVFVRALYIKKSMLTEEECKNLDKGIIATL